MRKRFWLAFKICFILILVWIVVIELTLRTQELYAMLEVTSNRVKVMQAYGEDLKTISEQVESYKKTLSNPFFVLLLPMGKFYDDIKSIDSKINDRFSLYSHRLKEQKKIEEKEQIVREHEKNGIPRIPIQAHKLIVIHISSQRLFAYEDGISIFSYPVPAVTGKSGYATVTGEFKVLEKLSPYRMLSPFQSERYDSTVDYWLPFFEDYGIHDAWWRTEFGKDDYLTNGTHGCVNIPHEEMSKLFQWVDLNTTVIIQ